MLERLEAIRPTRRQLFAGCAAAAFAVKTAFAQKKFGPPPHPKGRRVFLDYDQVELDAAYDQSVYEPNLEQIMARFASNSEATRARVGSPQRVPYGPTQIEKLDIYQTKRARAPIFVLIHGGAWRRNTASDHAFPAELFVRAGAHYVVPDFTWVQDAQGNLMTVADQVRRAVGWVYKNAHNFDGNPNRLYLGGVSSGGHLCAVLLTTDWKKDFDLPSDVIKGGVCISGMYDLRPVRLSARSFYIKFDDATEETLSPQRHLEYLNSPVIVAYGTLETPEFQRQGREFAAALKAAGKPVEVIVGRNYAHLELQETLANPYGLMGRAVLHQMRLAQA